LSLDHNPLREIPAAIGTLPLAGAREAAVMQPNVPNRCAKTVWNMLAPERGLPKAGQHRTKRGVRVPG